MPRREKCETCHWFHRHCTSDTFGQCRKKPPVLLDSFCNVGVWPEEPYYAWCGDWKPIESIEVDQSIQQEHTAIQRG